MELEKISDILPRTEVAMKLEKLNKEKKLTVARKQFPKIPTSMQAMELSLIFNSSLEERKQGWCKRYLRDDYYVEARAVIPELGAIPDLIREEDLNTLLACFLLLKHSRARPGKYAFETTAYQVLRLLGQSSEGEDSPTKDFTGGGNYKRLKHSLDRLQANRISTNFWWDMILGQRIIESNFHFLESVDKGQEKALRITLGSKIAESLEKGYLKILEESDLKHIIKLRGHAKVLALLLIKLLGYKTEQTINLRTTLKYLGVKERWGKLPAFRFNENIKRTIVPAMENASSAIGLSCTYNKDKEQFFLRRIKKTKQIEGPANTGTEKDPGEKAEENQDPLLTRRKNEAFKKLADIGVHPEMITKIFADSTIEEIERQIEWLPYRESGNPAGVFVSSIYKHWGMPPEYERRKEEALKAR